jgi:hypothetical protein
VFYFTDVPCSYISRLDSQFLSMSTNSSDCKSECSGNVDCWATVEMFPDTCIMLASIDPGLVNFQMFSKFCYNGDNLFCYLHLKNISIETLYILFIVFTFFSNILLSTVT